MSLRVGIFGGTFNPIHVGHLIMAQNAQEAFDLDKVLFMPCAAPPHKMPRDVAPAKHRLAMLRKALAGNKAFEASDLEIRRGGKKSYTYDTLKALKSGPRGRKARYLFIIGTDMLAQIFSWYRIRDIMRMCRFIVLQRPGRSAKTILARMTPKDKKYFSAYVLSSFTIDVSSREIRRRLARGLSVRYLVTPPVEAYLRKTRLYA